MSKHLCPWWLGFWLLIPFRPLIHDPDRILAPFLKPGMTVLDVGPGMGYFSLPMARMVGPGGKVICVDVQQQMLRHLARRAAAARLGGRIVTRLCSPYSLALEELSGTVDFALVFAVVHEVPEQADFFAEIARALKPGGLCLFVEPKGRVPLDAFEESLRTATQKGLLPVESPRVRLSRSVLLKKW